MIETNQYGAVTQFIMGRLMDDGKPIYTMGCYYVDGLLIDTGPVHVAEEIVEAFSGYPVKTIVNTHHHEDHVANNIIFQEKMGVGPALAHPLAVPRIENPDSWISRLRAYQHLAWGSPPASRAIPIGQQLETEQFCFRVIYTPGHSDDHICLLEEKQGWLFSGDLFINEEVKTLRSDENAVIMMDSLKMLLDYDFSTIFCSSGRVVENARQAVKKKINYWEELRTDIIDLYKKGCQMEEIRDKILGRESALFIPTEGDFGKINLVRSFIEGSLK